MLRWIVVAGTMAGHFSPPLQPLGAHPAINGTHSVAANAARITGTIFICDRMRTIMAASRQTDTTGELAGRSGGS